MLGWGISGTADAARTQLITLQVEPQLAGQPVMCGASYPLQGADGVTVRFADLRLFVSAIELVDVEGRAVPLRLEQDGRWQYRDTVLLDFEDGQVSCANGSSEQHRVITGRIQPGRYRGLRFMLGVPARFNHQDATLAPSPLNQTALFWSWQGGYRFMKLELDVLQNGQVSGFPIHLGSTGCQSSSNHQPATRCRQPNRVQVDLPDFDLATDRVRIDLSTLIAHTRLASPTPNTAPGCMSAPDDPDCDGVLSALGLTGGNSQRVFGVVKP